MWAANAPVDGIWMASNVSGSCMVWPLQITSPEEVIDAHGGIEPLRSRLGPGHALAANQLCWLTDRTPHEAVPWASSGSCQRSFFRLVVGPIGVWYSRHNTRNPLGVEPDAPISDEDKFGSA